MDEWVRRGLLRWPDVPAVYGWLRLDARGEWRLRDPASGDFERIGNPAMRAYLSRNYAGDTAGRWYFQNGPQRVYVTLERAPLVFRIEAGGWVDHCGRAAGALQGAWLDDAGGLILLSSLGVGSLDDRDLAQALGAMVDEHGHALEEELEFRNADPVRARAFLQGADGSRVALGTLARHALAERFGFVADPRP